MDYFNLPPLKDSRQVSFADRIFARLFKLAAGLDYTIAIQWNHRTRSQFHPWKRSITHLVLGAMILMVVGCLCLAGEIGNWAYKRIVWSYEHSNHSQLQSRLDRVTYRQKGFEAQLDSLSWTESRIRGLYGMSVGQTLFPFGIGGRRNQAASSDGLTLDAHDRLFKASLLSQKLKNQLQYSTNTLANIQDFIRYRQKIWDHTPTVAPAKGHLSSGFGYRLHPITGEYAQHEGLDIVGDDWTPIYATASGIVKLAGVNGLYGNCVDLDHGNGYMTRFGHLSKILVSKGQVIKRYDLLGYMGRTGRVTGTHLHYEVHRDGRPINPSRFILPSGILVD